MSFVSSIVGGILGANAAGDAANVEATGAKNAQNLELQNQNAANAAQQTALTNITGAEQPYQSLGSTSANRLQSLVGTGFNAPTLTQAEQTPGFQFNLQTGTNAIDENAAATGTLLSGNTGTALQKFGEGLAENTYQQDYQNALSTYMANLQGAQAGVSSGLTSTGQLSSANLGIAGNTANIDLTGGLQQAQQINNAAAARAGGILGQSNAYSTMAGGIASGFGNVDTSGSSTPIEMLGELAGVV